MVKLHRMEHWRAQWPFIDVIEVTMYGEAMLKYAVETEHGWGKKLYAVYVTVLAKRDQLRKKIIVQ